METCNRVALVKSVWASVTEHIRNLKLTSSDGSEQSQLHNEKRKNQQMNLNVTNEIGKDKT